MIPLRPELFSFTDPKSVCQLTCTSKTLRKDVRESKAWARLAEAQLPPARPRDAASDALSRVRSQARRRLLADSLLQETPPPLFRPNRFDDFTFFVRFSAADGRVVWEGDLARPPGVANKTTLLDAGRRTLEWRNTLSLVDVWDEIKQSGSWDDMEAFLSCPMDNPWEFTYATEDYLDPMSITLIAIRNEDQAMLSLGNLIYTAPNGTVGHADQDYIFKSRDSARPLFSSARFDLRQVVSLHVTHDINGCGTLEALNLRIEHHSEEAVGSHNANGFVDICEPEQFEYLISYLAGGHHLAREQALATIEHWHVEAEETWGPGFP